MDRKSSFVGFEDSKYADGTFFDKYTDKLWEPETARVRELFETSGVAIPTQADWEELRKSVMAHG
uniref:Ribonucleotide-diphosphate reductase subunit beta n=1 Tax=Parastrongyloides trichosuri TaxID=131310 RepID=A0A0N4ZGN0_PARTI